MEVDEGGFERGVTEVGGELVELVELGACFKHVGGVAVPEGVGADLVLLFGEAAFSGSDFDGGPDAGFGHVMTAVVESLAQGDAGALPSAPGPGEEPIFVAVGFPEGAQALEKSRGNGDFARFSSFAVADTDDES